MLVRLRLLASVFDVAIAADCELVGDAGNEITNDYLLKNGRTKCPRRGTVGLAAGYCWYELLKGITAAAAYFGKTDWRVRAFVPSPPDPYYH